MEEVIVLVNFNAYLGGGETLLVRYSSYLQERNIPFIVFCLKDSYIHQDLIKRKIDFDKIKTFTFLPDFYYMVSSSRENLLNELENNLKNIQTVRFLTFCFRDVYSIFALTNRLQKCSITHLILHIEDDKYVGQTLKDKFVLKFFKKREFNNNKIIRFNHELMTLLNFKSSLISMATVISKYWNKEFGIIIPLHYTVPLPSFNEQVIKPTCFNKNKILWIGRIVDFKIPSIIQMIEFVNKSNQYTFTIVGNGDIEVLTDYMKSNNIDDSKIKLVGQVEYNQLSKIIEEHSIGYAMGTSLVELAQFKKPVIVALANYKHTSLKKMICGGLFYDKDLGCDGSELMITKEEDIKWTIPIVIREIESSYDVVANKCYNFAKENYSEKENFEKYTNIIKRSELLTTEDKNIQIPSSSFLRRSLFYYFN